ncbi:MAG: transcriptional regulator [Desulfurococcaceae archaeon]
MGEELAIDFSGVPLSPIGKRDISQLEFALIVGTLFRPEVVELIRDPIERSTWMDSLAVAAAALARQKAGKSVSEIAEELGRSEATIRSHLGQRTKAGKLVAETFEKLRKGELRLVLPFARGPGAEVGRPGEEKPGQQVAELRQELDALRRERDELARRLSDALEALKKIRAALSEAVEAIDALIARGQEGAARQA